MPPAANARYATAKDGRCQHGVSARTAEAREKSAQTMPARVDKLRVSDPVLDRRVKMLPCQRERAIGMHCDGVSINGIARCFKVSKRTIQFLLFPERHAKTLKDRAERGGSKQYYDKEYHKASMFEHRKYKEKIFNK